MVHAFSRQSVPSPREAASLPEGAAGKLPGRDLMFDYLAREVFERLPAATRGLLERTSMLESVPVALARLLSGSSRARRILLGLQRDNLLTAATDAESEVFRYHPLFREFLHERFAASFSDRQKQALYRSGAEFYEKAGNAEEAVRLHLEAGQFKQAGRLIEALGLKLIRLGKKRTLLDWLQAMPARMRSARPRLVFYQGLAAIVEDPAGSTKLLAKALRGFRQNGDLIGQVLGVGTLIEIHTLLRAEFGRIPPLARTADSLLHRLIKVRAAPELRAYLLRQLGLSYYLVLGRFPEARALLEESLKISRRAGEVAEQIQTLTYLAWCTSYAGEPDLAREHVEHALTLLGRRKFKQEWEPMAWMAKAVVNSFEARFEEGLSAAAQAERLTAELGTTSVHPYNLTVKGFLLMETGRLEEARQSFETCRQMAAQIRYHWFEFLCGMFLTKLHLIAGDPGAARIEAKRMIGLGEAAGGRFFYAWGAALAGMVELELRRFRSARRHLERALRAAREMKTSLLEATVHLGLAHADFAQGRKARALAALEEGFRLIAGLGSSFYPLWYPSMIARACGDALLHNIYPDTAAALLTGRAPKKALLVLSDLVHHPDPAVQIRGVRALAGVKGPESEKILRDAVRSANMLVRQAAREALTQHQQDTLPRLSIQTLGAFRVYRGDELVPDRAWRGKRMKTLLKLLVALGGSKVSQETMMDTLWPGNDAAAAAVNLRSLLSRLRRTLEPGMETGFESFYLRSKEGSLSLDQDRCRVDVKEFHHHIEEGKKLERDQRLAEALAAYREAGDLYQGDFLEEDRNEDWVLPFREQLISEYLDLLHRIARLAESLGEPEDVPMWYWKILTKNPLDEEASRGLMRSLHRLGRRAEALRAYQECRERLIAELGVEPTEETTALYREIRESLGKAA
jgi:DNA-binding SARP family transcriptional activator